VRKKEPKQDVEASCPACGVHIVYQQRASLRSVKLIPCKECGTKLVSRFTERGVFALVPRSQEPVEIDCPHCAAHNSVQLENIPGSSAIASCASCQHSFRVRRMADHAEVTAARAASAPISEGKVVVTEETVELVRRELPAQPWPTGTSNEIATKLGLSGAVVRRAIDELIRRGEFFRQMDGVLYAPVQPSVPAGSGSSTRNGSGRVSQS
jgi:predicted Zn finger-like uncharacterized protein